MREQAGLLTILRSQWHRASLYVIVISNVVGVTLSRLFLARIFLSFG